MAFGFQPTSDDVLRSHDLTGKRAVVTGVSAGLVPDAARHLAEHGAWVLELVEMDLASLASARACAGQLLDRGEPIDLIICNAGLRGCPEARSVEGFETQSAPIIWGISRS